MNTDPLVFGGAFSYALCRQEKSPILRSLEPGDLVVFGSHTRNDGFILDTVFVVATRRPWAEAIQDLDSHGLSWRLTVEPMLTNDCRNDDESDKCARFREPMPELIWYTGATLDNPVHGMFSFVPAHPHTSEGAMPFLRPRVDTIDGIKNPQSLACQRKDALTVWRELVKAVQAAGLVLATRLEVEML